MRIAAIMLSFGLLSGCGTMDFKPAEYPLRDGLIPPFNVAGTVSVSNVQPADGEFIVYSYGPTKLASNLKSITDVMVAQTRKELEKNGRPAGGAAKSIDLRVDSLLSEYTGALFYRSSIVFQARLGNGQTLDFKVPHSSGSPHQNLNGNSAEGVMTMLRDERVRAYLGS